METLGVPTYLEQYPPISSIIKTPGDMWQDGELVGTGIQVPPLLHHIYAIAIVFFFSSIVHSDSTRHVVAKLPLRIRV